MEIKRLRKALWNILITGFFLAAILGISMGTIYSHIGFFGYFAVIFFLYITVAGSILIIDDFYNEKRYRIAFKNRK